ncbi:hypothetical protein C8R42DRAFT_94803 [Lentinula raphanica]|nr:hypothetical protein C8R42DRAFT_94803 [Lentinula raphanica]
MRLLSAFNRATTIDAQNRRRCALIAAVITTVTAVAGVHSLMYKQLNPEPYHTSSLTGAQWVAELEQGHSERMLHNLGVPQHVFRKLKRELQKEGGLKGRRFVDIEEMLATFLFQSVTNLSVRKVAERFQRSFETKFS